MIGFRQRNGGGRKRLGEHRLLAAVADQRCHVFGRGILALRVEARDGRDDGVGHADLLRRFVHQLKKRIERAGNGIGDHAGGVVGAVDHQRFDQLAAGVAFVGPEIDRAHAVFIFDQRERFLGDLHLFVEIFPFFNGNDGGKKLDEGRGRGALGLVLVEQNGVVVQTDHVMDAAGKASGGFLRAVIAGRSKKAARRKQQRQHAEHGNRFFHVHPSLIFFYKRLHSAKRYGKIGGADKHFCMITMIITIFKQKRNRFAKKFLYS